MPATPTFASLGVPEPLVLALKTMHFDEPFEIQALTIPDAIDGRDILGRAPTGSGKTLAFGLPLLAGLRRGQPGKMSPPPDPRRPDRPTKRGRPALPTGLVLCPTRELAEQIRRELEPFADAVDRTILAVYGGRGLGQQLKGLSKGVDLLVACPGRLLDLINQNAVDLGDVDMVVVDEADRMADMGFLPDVRKLLDQTSPDRQTMLYSATLDREVKVLVDQYQHDPIEHAVAELEPDLSQLTHRFIQVPKRERIWLAADLVTDMGATIVFVRTRHGADRVARQLKNHGVKAAPIHGGRSQSQRDKALAQFTGGKVQALVATDVAARGIHVDGVEAVVHYDPPAEHKDYVHRSGRTGRAGASGVVVSLLDKPQVRESLQMQNRLGIESDIEELPERVHHLDPIRSGSGSGSRSGGGSRSGSGSRSGGGGSRSGSGSRSGGGGGARSGSRRSGSKRSSSASRSGSGAGSDSKRSGSKSRSGSGAVSDSKRSDSGPQSDSKRSNSQRSRSGSSSSASGSGESTGQGQGRKSGGKHKGKASSGPKAGSTSGSNRSSSRPASKRSGKPRPKNRKNKPKSSRGRR